MARNLKSKKARKLSSAFMTRNEAIRKLQLSLKDFRRLCILKGIYPTEVDKKTSKTSSQTQTYYLRKDILFLSHEPIIWRFWEFKIFMKRMAKAKGRKDTEWIERIRENKPTYKLDHIVKERYPTIIDALRDLDDALSMCFLFSRYSKSKTLPLELVELCRRLTLEFMYYIMETKSLRKVFISIKGFYYEANVMGQVIRWIVPHNLAVEKLTGADFQVMKTFTEFYITMLGFVNYKLYISASYFYPPKFFGNTSETTNEEHEEEEVIAALNRPLMNQNASNQVLDEQSNIDYFENETSDQVKFGSSTMTFHQLQKFQNLFAGLKFFLNREVPRESLCFIIRSFSGDVSWDNNLYPGATFDEDNEQITHQIVDREMSDRYMNRHYIQPQWVFDCVNSRRLLPEQNYFIGAKLPPHLSPFVEEKPGDYVPPEKAEFFENSSVNINNKSCIDMLDEEMNQDAAVEIKEEIDEKMNDTANKIIADDKELAKNSNNNAIDGMLVKKSKAKEVNMARQMEQAQNESKRLREMMMTRKQRNLYNNINKIHKNKAKEKERLKRKREEYERKEKKLKN